MTTNRNRILQLLILTGIALSPASGLRTASAADYEIDPAHTNAQFSVRHLMVSNVRGEFTDVKGTVSFDPAHPETAKIDVSIDPKTVNTRVQKRDDHLRSPDFFDVSQYPAIVFKSKKIEKIAEDKLKVTGDLSIRGVSKEVVLDVDNLTPEVKDPWGNLRRGASATAKVNRKDFGLTWNKALETGGVVVGDDVSITIDVEMTKKGDASKVASAAAK